MLTSSQGDGTCPSRSHLCLDFPRRRGPSDGRGAAGCRCHHAMEEGRGFSSSDLNSNSSSQCILVMNIFWATSIAAIQISCLLSYSQLYDSFRLARNVCNVLVLAIVAWWFSTLVVWLNTCRPLAKAFNPEIRGACPLNDRLACGLIGCIHAFFDIAIMIAPIPAIVTLRLSFSEKSILSVLFLSGSLYVSPLIQARKCCLAGYVAQSQ
jgi:hypothetical protein